MLDLEEYSGVGYSRLLRAFGFTYFFLSLKKQNI